MWQCRKSRRNLGPKKLVLFPDIGRVIFFSLTRPQVKCVSEYIFLISKKQTIKKTRKHKRKRNERRKENVSVKSIKRVNLRPPG